MKRTRYAEEAILYVLPMRFGGPAEARVCCGYYRIYILLRREGWKVNYKRVYRPYEKGG